MILLTGVIRGAGFCLCGGSGGGVALVSSLSSDFSCLLFRLLFCLLLCKDCCNTFH